MALILGLAAAVTYGAADFLGGHATRRTGVFGVVFVSQLIGSALFFLALPFFAEVEPTNRAFLWGGLSGFAGGVGVLFFYQALALGRMSVVAPITGVEAAIVPVLWGLATGERPALVALAGVGLALVAVALVSAALQPGADDEESGRPRTDAGTSGLPQALAAGLGFGFFFILLAEAGEGTGLWPLVSARLASLGLVGIAILVGRRAVRPAPGTLSAIAGAGLFDVTANLLYLLASREGLLSLVAVLTSMYPASTVLLARVVLNERLVKLQIGGLAIAVVGVTLIGIG